MAGEQKNLNLILPIATLITFAVFVGTSVACLSQINKIRNQKIVDRYTAEMNRYFSENQPSLEILFNKVFDASCSLNCSESATKAPCHKKEDACRQTKAQLITNLISQDLSNFSSTWFLKEDSNGNPKVMHLSGEIGNFYLQNRVEHELPFKKLLSGEVKQLPWEDYTTLFPNKEVIIPFKDGSGKTLGAVIRGVFE